MDERAAGSGPGRCDYSGLHALIGAIRQAAAAHVELRIVLPDREVLGALRLMGLDHKVDVYGTVEAALTGSRPVPPQ